MKTGGKRWVIGVLVLVALISGGWLFFGHNNEPRYQGKPVSYWFKEYYSPSHATEDTEPETDSRRAAIKALSAMGSNALPYLVRVAFSTNQDSASRTNFYNLLAKLPDSWHLPQLITQEDIRNASFDAIQKIGPSASDILPLVQSKLDGTNARLRQKAIFILNCVKSKVEMVVPYLAKSIHDSDSAVQNISLAVLGGFGSKASLALPELMDVFEKAPPGDPIRWKVTFVLEQIGSNAAPAILPLKEAFERETNLFARGRIASCLYKINPGQTYAFDYLIGILTNTTMPGQISFGAAALAEIGPSARLAIPALLAVLKTTNFNDAVSGDVVMALIRLGASDDQVLAVLKPKLDSDSDELREDVFDEIRNLDPSEHEAVLALADLVLRHSRNEKWAIFKLGKIGSNAEGAVPVLKLEMNGTNNELGTAAKFALLKIDPKAVEK